MGLEVIEESFVKQYSTNVLYEASQVVSKLRGTVMTEEVRGEEKYWDRYGTVEMLERTQRFGDSPLNITPRDSRRLALFAYDTGEPIDTFDQVRTLNDPASPIVQRHAQAVARQFDRTIINAGLGAAIVGRKTPQTVNLPSTQVIASDNHDYDDGVGDVGLTVGKLIAAKRQFGISDVDTPPGGFHMAVTANQIADLLKDDAITSSDYNIVKALVKGEVNTFMGFTFHQVTPSLLPTIVEGGRINRRAMAYTSDAIVLGMGQDMKARITERSDKSFNWYAYISLFIGATRTDEVKVIDIRCDEGAAA